MGNFCQQVIKPLDLHAGFHCNITQKCIRTELETLMNSVYNKFNKLTSVFHASDLLLINIVKVAVDPRRDSQVVPQTTLTVL